MDKARAITAPLPRHYRAITSPLPRHSRAIPAPFPRLQDARASHDEGGGAQNHVVRVGHLPNA